MHLKTYRHNLDISYRFIPLDLIFLLFRMKIELFDNGINASISLKKTIT